MYGKCQGCKKEAGLKNVSMIGGPQVNRAAQLSKNIIDQGGMVIPRLGVDLDRWMLCESCAEKWNRGQFFKALRIAVTGKNITPPLIESMALMDKKEIIDRIKKAINKLTK